MLGHARSASWCQAALRGLEDVGDMRVDLRLRHIAQRMAGRQRFARPDFPVAEALAMELVHPARKVRLTCSGGTLVPLCASACCECWTPRTVTSPPATPARRPPPGPHLGEQRGIERILIGFAASGKLIVSASTVSLPPQRRPARAVVLMARHLVGDRGRCLVFVIHAPPAGDRFAACSRPLVAPGAPGGLLASAAGWVRPPRARSARSNQFEPLRNRLGTGESRQRQGFGRRLDLSPGGPAGGVAGAAAPWLAARRRGRRGIEAGERELLWSLGQGTWRSRLSLLAGKLWSIHYATIPAGGSAGRAPGACDGVTGSPGGTRGHGFSRREQWVTRSGGTDDGTGTSTGAGRRLGQRMGLGSGRVPVRAALRAVVRAGLELRHPRRTGISGMPPPGGSGRWGIRINAPVPPCGCRAALRL